MLPNTDLEYLIRFQNTGTDTAFTVLVRDKLSPLLDPATLRPVAGSHPFTWSMEASNELVIRFDNIDLVDSFANEPASHGFVRFHIAQQPALPWGTVIANSAAIYFDFNPPVLTNETSHEIGDLPHVSAVPPDPGESALDLLVYPNPVAASADIYVQTPLSGPATGRLYNAQGRLVQTRALDGQRWQLPLSGLSPGLYRLELWNGAALVGTGKVMIK